MQRFFRDKVIIITGSGQGIGKATAEYLGSLGAKICLNGRNADKLQKAGDELRAKGIDCFEVKADLSEASACMHLIDACTTHFGKLDILINNAGVATRGRIAEIDPETWDQTMRINFYSAVNCTFYALPHLLSQKGSVVMVSSMAGKVGVPGHGSYSASKMPLTAYTRALQNEYKKSDLHCGLIFVGFTDNEEDKEILSPDGTYKSLPKRGGIKLSSRAHVAKSIAKCLINRENQRTLTTMGKLQHIILKFAPGIVYSLLRKAYRDYDKMYKEK